MKKRMYMVTGILLIFGLLLSACGQPSPTSPAGANPTASGTAPTSSVKVASPSQAAVKPKYGGTINIAARAAINNIGGSGDFPGSDQLTFLSPPTERLFEADKNGKLIPVLADSWDSSADGLSYTFHLKKGIKFHDGTDFDAEAVRYTIQNNAKTYPDLMANIATIEAVDTYTVRMIYKRFDANFFLQLAQSTPGQICSPTALKIQSKPETLAKDHMVGTGPFQFASWQRNNNIKYDKFTGYWQNGSPYLNSVQWTEFADPTTAIMALKSGQVNLIDSVAPQDAPGLKEAGFIIDMTDYSMQRCLVPDSANQDSPYSNQKVREAVEWALDRKAIAKSLGLGVEACTQLASSTDAVYDPVLIKPRDYSLQKAKELLAAAGYPNGFKTALIALTNENKDLMVAMQGYLKEAGIDAEIQMVDGNKMAQLNKEGWKNGLVLWLQGNMATTVSVQRYFSDSTTYYKSMVKSTEMMKLINDSIAEPDYNKRLALMKSWQKYMSDNALAIPLYTGWRLQARSPKIHDLNWGRGFTSYYNWSTAWISE